MNRRWNSQLPVWMLVGIMLAMVGALLAWHADTRYVAFRQSQQNLIRSSVNGTAGEIAAYLTELRCSVRLFVDSEKALLDKLRSHPEDSALHDQLNRRLRLRFPEAFAFTLADRYGNPLLDYPSQGTDFEELVQATNLPMLAARRRPTDAVRREAHGNRSI